MTAEEQKLLNLERLSLEETKEDADSGERVSRITEHSSIPVVVEVHYDSLMPEQDTSKKYIQEMNDLASKTFVEEVVVKPQVPDASSDGTVTEQNAQLPPIELLNDLVQKLDFLAYTEKGVTSSITAENLESLKDEFLNCGMKIICNIRQFSMVMRQGEHEFVQYKVTRPIVLKGLKSDTWIVLGTSELENVTQRVMDVRHASERYLRVTDSMKWIQNYADANNMNLYNHNHVELIMLDTNTTREEATQALTDNDNDVVKAIGALKRQALK